MMLVSVFLLFASCMARPSPDSFVSTCGSQLVVNQTPFYFIGANAYWLIDYPSLVEPFFNKCKVMTEI